jgi:putative ABC transport system permease protein
LVKTCWWPSLEESPAFCWRWLEPGRWPLAPAQILRVHSARVDVPVLLVGLAASLVTGVVFGLIPAWRTSQVDLNRALKAAGHTGGDRSRTDFQSVLAIAEMALAFVLMMGAGLVTKSVLRLMSIDLGYDPHNVLTLTTNVWSYQPAADRPGYYQQVLDRFVPHPASRALRSPAPSRWIRSIAAN